MPQFKFRLEKVLEVKEIELKRCQKAMADALQETREAQERLTKILETTEMFTDQIKNIERATASDFSLHFEYLNHLMDEADAQNSFLQQLQEKEEEVRENLLETKKNQQMMINLKMQAQQKFIDAKTRQDQKQMDEITFLSINKRKVK